MDKHNEEEFKQLLAGICDVHGKQLSAAGLKIYWHTLKPYPFDKVVSAIMAHEADPDCGQYMPKPADIIAQINGRTKQADTLFKERALYYWSIIQGSLHKGYQALQIDDPDAIEAMRRIGGLNSLAMDKTDHLVYRQNAFVDAYVTIKHSARLIGNNPALVTMTKTDAAASLERIHNSPQLKIAEK